MITTTLNNIRQRTGYLLHTVRYLRPVQIYGRLWHKLYHPQPETKPAPLLRVVDGVWRPPVQRSVSMVAPAEFRFLNETHVLDSALAWNHPDWDKLWLYNLHYFDDLNAADADKRQAWHRDLIERWIRENPPAQGVGWESYPLSLRIVNWIKWALSDYPLPTPWLHSLAIQTRFLARRLEFHLLGNHLFENAKALIFAGLFFDGGEAAVWLRKGLTLVQREIQEQILADGGHFERSPMYHSIILEDLLDLLNLANVYASALLEPATLEHWRAAARRMRYWLKVMRHPDGDISFFNDAALAIAASPAVLEAYAERLGLDKIPEPSEGIVQLRDSGYIRLRQAAAVVLLDVAPLGPDYLLGHAHADTLSFELSLFGQRVLVNSGTSCYGVSPERLRQRSTAAHNTLVVDGENSSEVWGGFRVARRARPFGLEVEQADGALRVNCGHDGYRRLPGKPLHWRRWELSAHRLLIHDRLLGQCNKAVTFFYFHPAVNPVSYNDHSGWLDLPERRTLRWEIIQGVGSIHLASYHPYFGVSQANYSLTVQLVGSEAKVAFRWE